MFFALSLMPSVIPQNPPAQQPTLHLTPYPQLLSTRFTAKDGLPPGEARVIYLRDKNVVVSTNQGQAEFDGKRWNRLEGVAIPAPPGEADRPPLPPGAVVTSW